MSLPHPFSMPTPADSAHPLDFPDALTAWTLIQAAFNAARLSWGPDLTTTAGLSWGYLGGIASDGAGGLQVCAGGVVDLAGSATNYVERTDVGVVSVNQTGWTAGRIPMAKVITSPGAVSSWTDYRTQAMGNATPQPLGTASTGTSGLAARQDHVHANTAATQAVDDSSTKLATTAWYMGQQSTAAPTMAGVAAAGTSKRWSPGDHVHPTDTSRAPVASPTFTGTASAPTLSLTGGVGGTGLGTGDLQVAGGASFGGQLFQAYTDTITSGTNIAFAISHTTNPGGASSATLEGFQAQVIISSTSSANITGSVIGGEGRVTHNGTGKPSTVIGLRGFVATGAGFTAPMGTASGFTAQVSNAGNGVVDLAYAYRALSASNGGSGSITKNVALKIENQTAGATNFAIETGTGPCSFGDAVTITGKTTLNGGLYLKRTTVGDANVTAVSTDSLLVTTASFTAQRTWTLPAASNGVQVLWVSDEFGAINGANTLVVARAGSDTIRDGTTSGATSITLATAGSKACFISNGSNQWTRVV